MTKGGARARSGPAPDPQALRRDRKTDLGWTVLPVEERSEAPPDWPLVGASERETELWGRFWAKPQAILWERNAQVFEVAMHVRCFAEAELPCASTSLRTLVRQQADALLLTIPAMHAARVKLSGDDLSERRAQSAPKPVAVAPSSSRSRLRSASSSAPGA